MNLQQLKKDLNNFNGFEVIVFGSYAAETTTPRSDIDVAIITRCPDREENKKIWLTTLGKAPEKYEVKIFELLPLPVQISIIRNYKIVYGNSSILSEYFYYYRKLWNDIEARYEANQFKSVKEKIAALENAKHIASSA